MGTLADVVPELIRAGLRRKLGDRGAAVVRDLGNFPHRVFTLLAWTLMKALISCDTWTLMTTVNTAEPPLADELER